ncbi:hypothetical protein CRG98_005933 [Punica granatum]|uniref:At2g24240-like C-terminal beta-propeller domain-containing protein n=2 Tax=Punica granatum TaxID=22663 RepID=A0A2I0KZ10_PUNGR|nr:hypothetical protein CRG98_005933 [Punica granatum]
MDKEIAVWDPVTGKLKWRLGGIPELGVINKLQWFSGINCVLAVCIINEQFILSFLDHRVKKVILDNVPFTLAYMIADAVADETRINIYLIDGFMNLGFLDCRQLPFQEGIQWMSENSFVLGDDFSRPESIHCHEGQLFAHMRSNASAFSSDDWVLAKVQLLPCIATWASFHVGSTNCVLSRVQVPPQLQD